MMSHTALVQALINSANQHHQHLQGKRIWLACSGGRDSLSLASICHQLFNEHQLPFLPQLLHVNHGMQAANDSWAIQVQAWAQYHDMTCHMLTISLDNKTEQAARKARYDAMISKMNCHDVLILGHHMDDQVETVLMRLFNGAGVNGLSGMSEWTVKHAKVSQDHKATDKMVHLWRPWLSVSRDQITQYAKDSELVYIDDPTNTMATAPILSAQMATQILESGTVVDITMPDSTLSNNTLSDDTVSDDTVSSAKLNDALSTEEPFDQLNFNDRAWLRSLLMPIIKERYPQVNNAIYRSSQLMQDASSIINQQADVDLKNMLVTDDFCPLMACLHSVIDINRLLKLSKERQSTVIHSWLHPQATEMPPSKRLVDDVLSLCQRNDNDHQTILHWHSGVYHYDIRRHQNKLYRLRTDWLDWLTVPPDTQQIDLKNLTADSIRLKKQLNLKSSQKHSPSNDELKGLQWEIKGIRKLVDAIQADCLQVDDFQVNDLQTTILQIEPLPRDLKVTLQGREGRKSGKKLLQALNQPSFMRPSVALLSILQDEKMPLAIICVDTIHLLQTDTSLHMSEKLKSLTNHDITVSVNIDASY